MTSCGTRSDRRQRRDRRSRSMVMLNVWSWRTRAVIGEVQGCSSTQRRCRSVFPAARRYCPRECASMLACTMLSARLPCSAILSRSPVEHLRRSRQIVAAPVFVERRDRRRTRSPSVRRASSTDSPAKLFTKLSGFLISWAMPGGQLAERRHLLRPGSGWPEPVFRSRMRARQCRGAARASSF